MGHRLMFSIVGALLLTGCDPGDPQWQHVAGSTDEELSGHVAAGASADAIVVTDSATQTTGYFPLGGHPGLSGGTIHFARYAEVSGVLLDSASFGAQAPVRDIAADAAGNTYIIGRLNAVNDFGAGPGPASGTYILKVDPSGAVLWSHQFAATLGGGPEEFRHLAYDASSDTVLVAGVYSTDDFDFDLGTGPLFPELDGFYVARFDNDGTTLDVSTGFSEVGPMAVSPSGDFAMTGFYGVEDTLVIGGTLFNAPGLSGNFFAVLDASFAPVGVLMSDGANFSTRYAVAAAADGTYWATSETGDVPGGPTSGNTDYVAHYDAAGAYLGHRELVGDANPQGVAVGDDGPVVVGNFTAGADLGTGPLSAAQGMFTVQYDTNLDPVWVNTGTTTTGHVLGLDDVAVLEAGSVAVAGQNSGDAQIEIGLGTISGYGPALDTFIAVFAG